MANITRKSDGLDFVSRPVRENIIASQRKNVHSALREGVKKYGEWCHVAKITDNKYSLTYSQEEAYILGEVVADYYGRPPNLIWCENISSDEKDPRVAIVIIKNHEIKLDAEMPATAVVDDISLAIGGSDAAAFDIFVFGDVPIKAKHDSEDDYSKIVLSPERVNSFTILQVALLDILEPKPEHLTVQPGLALKRAGFKNYIFYIAGAVLLIIIAGVLFYPQAKKVHEQTVVINDYKTYRQELAGTTPSQMILSTVRYMDILNQIGGWNINSIAAANGYIKFKMDSIYQNYKLLEMFAKQFNGSLMIKNQSGFLSLRVDAKKQASINNIANEKAATMYLLKNLATNSSFSTTVTVPTSNGRYKSRGATISMNSVSLPDLLWLAKALNGLPVQLINLSLLMEKTKIKGTLTIKIYGY